MLLREGARILFIGDSITDAGRSHPVGRGDGLGSGYVAQFDALVAACHPEMGIETLNLGVSGNTTRHLAQRWERDVRKLEPDWLAVLIGINDVWRQFDSPDQPDIHVLADEFESTLDRLVSETKPQSEGLLLATPFFIEVNRQDPMRARMDEYGAIVEKIAANRKVILVDCQAAFDSMLKFVHSAELAGDRVHPNQRGSMVIARAFLRAIQFDWA